MSGSGSRSGSISEEGETTTSKISTSSLRARFEEKATESASPKRNFVINKGKAGEAAKKFNQGASTSTKCQVCNKSVYPMEKLEVEGLLYHKLCLKCETCKRTLGLGNYAALQGKFYCKPHLKQLFQLKGNYDEGFGRVQRKADWVKTDGPPPKSSTPAAETMQQEGNTEKVADDSPKETEKEVEPEVNGHADTTSETHEESPTEQAEEETPNTPEEVVEADDDVAEDEVVENGHAEAEVVSAGDEEIQNGTLSGGEETQNGNVSGEESDGDY